MREAGRVGFVVCCCHSYPCFLFMLVSLLSDLLAFLFGCSFQSNWPPSVMHFYCLLTLSVIWNLLIDKALVYFIRAWTNLCLITWCLLKLKRVLKEAEGQERVRKSGVMLMTKKDGAEGVNSYGIPVLFLSAIVLAVFPLYNPLLNYW